MLADMIREGVGAFVSGREVAARRRAIGVPDEVFATALLAAAFTSFAGYLVPELNGVGAAVNIATGSEDSAGVTLGMALAFAGALAVVTVVQWLPGPGMVSFLSRRFGVPADLERARVWIYLTALATCALNVGILLADAALGLVAMASPVVAGWTSLSLSVLGLVAAVAVFASLCRDVLGLTGQARSILFAMTWLLLLIAIAVAVMAPLHAFFSGS